MLQEESEGVLGAQGKSKGRGGVGGSAQLTGASKVQDFVVTGQKELVLEEGAESRQGTGM